MVKRFGLTEFAQISEIVGAVAVVVSLIYVGIQLSANTNAVRAASIQSITNWTQQGLLTIIDDSELAEIRRVGDSDFGSLNEADANRYIVWNRVMWIGMQNIFLQRNLGVADDQIWDTYHKIICVNLVTPGTVATWSAHKAVLSPDFAAVVESCPRFVELTQGAN